MLIDRKNIIYNIKTKILSLLNTHWHIKNTYDKVLPNSNTIFKNDISKIITAVNLIPKHRKLGTNKSIVGFIDSRYTIIIYNNHSKENIQEIISPNITDIPVFIKDENSEIIDARVIGGGATKGYINDSVGKDLFIYSYSDVGRYDGMPTAATASVSIELPTSIKEKFSDNEILYIIQKYLAVGVHPVISYYDINETLDNYNWILSDVK